MIRCSRRSFLQKTALTTLVAAGVSPTFVPSAQAYSAGIKVKVARKVATTCEMCKAHCPMVVTVYTDDTLRLAGNSNNPIHGPFLCSRGLAASQILSHPDRLKYPMKRVGDRGQGKWQRITWDEALGEIGDHIRTSYGKSGGDGLALFAGGRSSHHIKSWFSNLACPSVCDSSYDRSSFIRSLGYGTTFGTVPDPTLVNLAKSRCLVLIGSHLGENILVPQMRQLTQALNRPDMELVVVDPRFSSMAAKSQHHLAIKPGTDTALILGWINYLIENKLYDHGFVEDFCVGFDELRQHVASYSLEKTAQLTDLPKAHIAGVAEIMAQAGAATTIMPGNQLSWYGNDVSRVRALAILSALLGVMPQDTGSSFDFALASKPVDVARVLGDVRSGKIGVAGIWGQNVVQSESPGYFVTKTLKDAEFVFCTDIFPSESALYADIILPEASFLERADFCETWLTADRKVIAGSFQVQAPLYECRSPFDIVKALADASGLIGQFSQTSAKDVFEQQAGEYHTSLAGLVHAGGVVIQRNMPADPVPVPEDSSVAEGALADDPFALPQVTLKTPSGKVELLSSWLRHNGYEPLPEYEAVMDVPQGFVRLLSGRCPVHTLSRTSGNAWLNHEISENVLWLSPETAAMYGVENSQRVHLESSDGAKSVNRIEIMVTPGIRDDCCYTTHGFGNLSPLMSEGYNKGVSVNRLLSRAKKDEVTGVRGLRDIFVRPVRG